MHGPSRACATRRRCQRRHRSLSHVTEQIDQPGVRERVFREMSEIYKGNLIFGEDLMEVPVKGPAAAKLMIRTGDV